MLRTFTRLKAELMPYIYRMPVLRPMAAEFPDDPACTHLDRQYMFGDRLLVAPVFTASGETSYYIPAGTWTHLQTGATARGLVWVHEVCDFETLPVFVRPASALPIGSRDDRPDYPYEDDVTLRVYEFPDSGRTTVTVPGLTGESTATFEVARDGRLVTAKRRHGAASWRLQLMGTEGSEIRVLSETDQCTIEMRPAS